MNPKTCFWTNVPNMFLDALEKDNLSVPELTGLKLEDWIETLVEEKHCGSIANQIVTNTPKARDALVHTILQLNCERLKKNVKTANFCFWTNVANAFLDALEKDKLFVPKLTAPDIEIWIETLVAQKHCGNLARQIISNKARERGYLVQTILLQNEERQTITARAAHG